MAKSNHYGLILAGGRGTRFWPLSRRTRAKQVLSVVGESTLIEATVARLSPLIPPQRLWVLTNSHLRAEIVRQLPQVPEEQILAEPEQKNTAPAIGLAAHILQSIDKNSGMGVFPSDHVILKPRRYLQFVRQAFQAAERGHIAVLGIAPRRPAQGFAAIQFPEGLRCGSPARARVWQCGGGGVGGVRLTGGETGAVAGRCRRPARATTWTPAASWSRCWACTI